MTSTMRALQAPSGDPTALTLDDVPRPAPAGGEVLVAVTAAAITPGELDWPEQRPAIPAHDVSGTVAELGAGVDGYAVGDPVIALVGFDRPGAAAEYVCVPSVDLAPAPAAIDPVAASAIPLGALTAWQALFDHAELRSGQHVLVHGGAGGVGSYAVTLAARHGATVTSTASSRDLELVASLGADTVLDYSEPFEHRVSEVDVVIDPVGGDVTGRSLAVLRPGGILVAVAEEPSEQQAEAAGVRAVYFVVEPNGAQLGEIATLAADGVVRPSVGRVVPLAESATAFLPGSGPRVSGRTVIAVQT